jgi:hypothetical protein
MPQDFEHLDRQNRQANIESTLGRLHCERAWVLHRAITIDCKNDKSEADSWKAKTGHEETTWSENQKQALIDKYYALLMAL